MRIIGLDSGLRKTGYGIINEAMQILESGVIQPEGKELGERLLSLKEKLAALLSKWQPSLAALEEVIYHKNPRSSLLLGTAWGVTLLALEEARVPAVAYSPTTIKLAITGNGKAKKSQVAFMVKALLDLKGDLSEHVTDALACALVVVKTQGLEKKYALCHKG